MAMSPPAGAWRVSQIRASGRFFIAALLTGCVAVLIGPWQVPVGAGMELIASDDFDRSQTPGWGEPDIGGVYTAIGPIDRFSTDGLYGRISLDGARQRAFSMLDEIHVESASLSFQVTTNRSPSLGGQAAYVVVRSVRPGYGYRLRVRVDTDGRVLLSSFAFVDNVRKSLGIEQTVPEIRFSPGNWLRVRAEILGTQPTVIRARVWAATTVEPVDWHYTISDNRGALQSPGSVGLGAQIPLNSSAAPVTFSFDTLRVADASTTALTLRSFATRPYTTGSAWNTPVGSAAELDPLSAPMVATIGLSPNGGTLSSDPTQYTVPVYIAQNDTPRHTVRTSEVSRIFEADETWVGGQYSFDMPMDPAWGPSAGTDAQMIVIQPVSGDEWDIFGYAGPGSYRAGRMSHYVAGTLRNGMPLDYVSRGAGVPLMAGLIRPWEVAQGHIDHAIAFGYPFPAKGRCVFPATKTDGGSTLDMAIPQGARLQLDPSLGTGDFDRWGLGATGRIIARAMQRYGIILIDHAGRPKLYAEDAIANRDATITWADVGGLGANTVAPIPYTALRVLDMPDGYWTEAADAPMRGGCYS